MIHALTRDMRGNETPMTFGSSQAMTRWANQQRRSGRRVYAGVAVMEERPSLKQLEQLANTSGTVVRRKGNRWEWTRRRDTATGFTTRPEALRAAYDAGAL